MGTHRRPRRRFLRNPHVVLAASIGALGLANLLFGLGVLGSVPERGWWVPLDETVSEGFGALGRSAQLGLGLALVVAAGGLARRMRAAWAFSILLLAAMLVTNLAQGEASETVLLGLPVVALLAGLVLARRAFLRQATGSSLLIAALSLTAVLGYGTLGTYLLGQGFSPPIPDLATALYFTVVTLATVGFGDVVPTTVETRMFTLTLILFGLGIVATTVATVFGTAVSDSLRRVLTPRGASMDLDDHVILIGSGPIAENTAVELRERRHAFVRVLPHADAEAADQGIVGDPSEDAVLEQAGIRRARLVIAATESDAENAMIALAAKDLNPHVRVLALAQTPERIPRLRRARADLVFAPAAVGGRLLAALAEGKPIDPEFRDLLRGEMDAPERDA